VVHVLAGVIIDLLGQRKCLMVFKQPFKHLISKLEAPIAEPGYPSKEKRMLIEALRQSNGNQTQAARILGINRVTVWNRMKKYGIDLKKVLTM
jgi:transcriptional regulator of acetoin/glycerol metabolism